MVTVVRVDLPFLLGRDEDVVFIFRFLLLFLAGAGGISNSSASSNESLPSSGGIKAVCSASLS